jgi:hypothetical protein
VTAFLRRYRAEITEGGEVVSVVGFPFLWMAHAYLWCYVVVLRLFGDPVEVDA